MEIADERLAVSSNPHWKGMEHIQEKIFDRDIQKEVFEYLNTKQILCLLGPRRTGKTTILRSLISKLLGDGIPPKQIFYFSFDELMSADHTFLDELLSFYFERIAEDKEGKCYILLDEIHNIDFWQTILKRHYDTLHPKTKFIVTGSSSVWVKRKSRESLAGRAQDFIVYPLSFREFLTFSGLEIPHTINPEKFTDLEKLRKSLLMFEEEIVRRFDEYLLKGGFPEVVTENMSFERAQSYIWSQVVEKTVLRDLTLYFPVENPKVIIEILRMLSWQSSGLFELKNLASTLNLNAATVSKYLSYLEIGYLLSFSYNYTKSRVKQVRSLKKVYVTDTGLITSIARLSEDTLAHPDETGRIVETSVRNHFSREAECYFWRDEHKNELDLVVRFSKSLLPIEVKYVDKLAKSDMKTLASFMNKYSIKRGIVATKSVLEDYGDIWAIPAWLLMLVDWRLS
jgi:predicted AAA+ superfamily ATPase